MAGKWKFRKFVDYDAEDLALMEKVGRKPLRLIDNDGSVRVVDDDGPVCVVCPTITPKRGKGHELVDDERDRLAALIAAAPELLKELKHLVRFMEPVEQEGGLNIPGLATLNGARAAIAKAEGRS